MARLTEEMVIARSRVSDLGAIKKLNCWGGELADVSILRRMNNLEVLSISVNKISSLADFQYCKSLRELYVRNNEISALNQICYLQQLPALKILWLAENPCAKEDAYRFTVLKALPNLEKLDDIVVQPEEVEDALRKGRDLIHPEDEDTMIVVRKPRSAPPARASPKQVIQAPLEEDFVEEDRYRGTSAPVSRPARRSTDFTNERIPQKPAMQSQEGEYEDEERYCQTSRPARRSEDFTHERPPRRPVNQMPPQEDEYVEENSYRSPTQTSMRPGDVPYELPGNMTNGSDSGSTVCEKCNSPLSPQGKEGNCEWESAPCASPNMPNGDINQTNSTNNDQSWRENGVESSSAPTKEHYDSREEYRRRGSSSSSNESGRSRSRTGSPAVKRSTEQGYTHSSGARKLSSPPRRLSRVPPNEDHYGNERFQSNVDDYSNVSSKEPQRPRDFEPRRTTTTNPNLLTAVMCLIMELDYEGLVHVERTVRRRKEEFTEDYQGL